MLTNTDRAILHLEETFTGSPAAKLDAIHRLDLGGFEEIRYYRRLHHLMGLDEVREAHPDLCRRLRGHLLLSERIAVVNTPLTIDIREAS